MQEEITAGSWTDVLTHTNTFSSGANQSYPFDHTGTMGRNYRAILNAVDSVGWAATQVISPTVAW